MIKNDKYYMLEALKEARKAGRAREVPVGAVAVVDGKIVGRGRNRSITDRDPTAHAEIVAVRNAAEKLNNYRLKGCRIYSTVEPCPMCAGMMVWARISEIVYGAADKKAGACGSVIDIVRNKRFNHGVKVKGGVLRAECGALIKDFFKKRR